jgi:hypoxanthine phosphoribosyltransferase
VKATPAEAWRILHEAEEICPESCVAQEVRRLAREISARLAERHPVVLGVMRGSVVFAGQLLPQLRFPLDFDYLEVTRYGDTTRGGDIAWKVNPGTSVMGRVVLVLDDILDEGKTLAAVREKLTEAGAIEFYTAVFADKQTGRAKPIAADFVGITVPDRYVFGFGMDVYGAWRNLPAIYALRET